jgi:hypothetical protein
MPPIGERLSNQWDSKPEQKQEIKERQKKVGKRIDNATPPMGYMIYPLYYGEGDTTMTLTLSAVARYEVDGNVIEAPVTRDINGTVWLRTFGVREVDGQEERREGVTIKVKREYGKGQLEYSSEPSSYDQHQSALDGIEETLDLIEQANVDVYGVRNFEDVSAEELKEIRARAEPGLGAWVDAEYYRDYPEYDPANRSSL